MLAWIPVVFAVLATVAAVARHRAGPRRARLQRRRLAAVLPQRALHRDRLPAHRCHGRGVPTWYDVMVVAWFAFAGLFLGVVSLYLMQSLVERSLGRPCRVVVLHRRDGGGEHRHLCRALPALEQLGRLRGSQRHRQPRLGPAARPGREPRRLIVFTALYFVFFLFVYGSLRLFAGFVREEKERRRRRVGHRRATGSVLSDQRGGVVSLRDPRSARAHDLRLVRRDGAGEWLAELPEIVAECEAALDDLRRVALRAGRRRLVGRAGATVAATRAGCSRSRPRRRVAPRARRLRQLHGDGMVRLIDAYRERGALLLERLEPGHAAQLAARRGRSEPHRGRAARPPAAAAAARPPLQACRRRGAALGSRPARRQRTRRTARANGRFVEEAVELAYHLAGSEGGLVLASRDFRQGNILAAQREPWLAIDPKPVIAEREYAVRGAAARPASGARRRPRSSAPHDPPPRPVQRRARARPRPTARLGHAAGRRHRPLEPLGRRPHRGRPAAGLRDLLRDA